MHLNLNQNGRKQKTISEAEVVDTEANHLDQKHTNTNTNTNQANEDDATKAIQSLQADPVLLTDLIGEFGFYQLSLTLVTFIRYICVAMMTNTGPLIAPSLSFWCQPEASLINSSSIKYPNASSAMSHVDFMKDKCSLDLMDGSQYKCQHWSYDLAKSGTTLTDTYDLVCDRDWLRSAFQSCVSIGVAIASVLFGSFSDEHGRRPTMNLTFAIALLAGLGSYWAPTFSIYTLMRALCTMCDLSVAGSLYTVIVETLGTKYRGVVCLIVTTGWSFGVMVMPWVTGYFLDFRKVMLFTVACHLATLPWLFTAGESVRWLLVTGRLKEAQREIHRICSWNMRSKQEMLEVDLKFEQLKLRYVAKSESRQLELSSPKKQNGGRSRMIFRTLFGGLSKVGEIFKSRELLVTSAVFIWVIFNSELLYMLFIMINSDVGGDTKLNYAIGGLMESMATLISIVLISTLTRKLSLSLTLIIISASMVCLAFTHDYATVSVYTLNFSKLAGSTLTSLVFVIITELFPTNLRQTGIGISSTLGSCGAIIAPFIHNQMTKMLGLTNVMLILCLFPLSAALLIPFFLRETKGVELADDVDEIT